MKAEKVKPGMRNIDLDLELVEMQEPHHFENEDGEGRVVTAIGKDDSGEVKISLWNEEIDKVDEGDKVKIESGYARLFQNEVHVSVGQYGELKVLNDTGDSTK